MCDAGTAAAAADDDDVPCDDKAIYHRIDYICMRPCSIRMQFSQCEHCTLNANILKIRYFRILSQGEKKKSDDGRRRWTTDDGMEKAENREQE